MKSKIRSLLYALMVSSWPYFIYLGIQTWAQGGDYLALFIMLFNWGFCFFLIPMAWWAWYKNQPRIFIIVGVILCLPIVYYAYFTELKLLNLAFGIPGILLGWVYQPKNVPPTLSPLARRLRLGYVLTTGLLPILIFLYGTLLVPSGDFNFSHVISVVTPILWLTIPLVLIGFFLRDGIFTFFSIVTLWMASMTLSEFFLLQSLVVLFSILGLTSLFVAMPKVKAPDTPA